MPLSRLAPLCLLALPLALMAPSVHAQNKPKGVWTDVSDKTLPPDFKFQGEFVGEVKGGAKLGCQVIALGNGAFQAVVLHGGLPREGWDGRNKILMDGKLEGDKANLRPTTGQRKYFDKDPNVFSATSKFPPVGQKDYTAVIAVGPDEAETVKGKTEDGKEFQLKKVLRKSPTLGARPPEGSIVLFDGKNADEWRNGGPGMYGVDLDKGTLNTNGSTLVSKRKFNNYTLHIEFMLPFQPVERNATLGRRDSGVSQVDLYVVRVQDSFGLDSKSSECGGFPADPRCGFGFLGLDPKVNMCLPPLVWQTYDIEFTNAVVEGGKKVKNARATVRHNGVVIHDNVEISGKTGGGRNEPEGTPGGFRLYGHGVLMQFRNIWIVERR